MGAVPSPRTASTSLQPNAVVCDRFVLRRHLGGGAMGEVWQAFDREFEDLVALKFLKTVDPATLDQFKREFRSISGLRHPNLVGVHELFVQEEIPFLVMDYVDGQSLSAALRGDTLPGLLPPAPLTELYSAIYQLSLGIDRIHREGWLHRDLKPENTIWTPSGQLLILDLGLARPKSWDPNTIFLGGTVPYMAPEQARREVYPASDWYALGVILYQLFSGYFPIWDLQEMLLRRKQVEVPPPLETRVRLPTPLAQLVDRLLGIAPEQRPAGPEVRRVLRELGYPAAEPDYPVETLRFVHHQRVREQLEGVLERRESRVVEFSGPSGVGKTLFIEDFCASARQHLCLRSRCRPEEHAAFKALDGPVEQLCDWVLKQEREYQEVVATGLADAALHLFPTLRRLPGLLPRAAPVPAEALTLRDDAFSGIISLFQEVAQRRPILLWVDDFQWVDGDSLPLLQRLLAGMPEGLLILRSARPDAVSLRREGTDDLTFDLLPLTRQELGELLPDWPAERVERAWTQTGGLPFLLADHLRGEDLEEKLSRLDALDTRMLEIACLAAGNLPRRVLFRAVGELRNVRSSMLNLVQARLLRLEGDGTWFEPSHDRVRERVILPERMTPDRKNPLHESLFQALLQEPSPDLQALFAHCLGAGRSREALAYALRAAQNAENSLAFATAARLYEAALRLGGPQPDLYVRLAHCSRNQGALEEAAGAWERAAALLEAQKGDREQVDAYRWHAAESLLHAGELEAGRSGLARLLGGIGVTLPTSPGTALARAFWFRLRYFLGRWLHLHRPVPASPAEERRLRWLWSASTALAHVEPMHSDALGAEHLLRASGVQDRSRLLRALGYEAAFEASLGGRFGAHAEKLLAEALALAEQAPEPPVYDRAWLELCSTVVTSLLGRFEEGIAAGLRAEQLFLDGCHGVDWELSVVRTYLNANLMYTGRLSELLARLRRFEESTARSQKFACTVHHLGQGALARTLAEDPELALRQARQSLERWPAAGFSTQHYQGLLNITQSLIFLHRQAEALAVLERQWPQLVKARYLDIEWCRNEAYFLRFRIQLAAILDGMAAPAHWADETRVALDALDRCGRPYAAAFAALIRLGLTGWQGGDVAGALALAEQRTGEVGLVLYHHAVRHRAAHFRGEVWNCRAEESRLRGRGVAYPERLLWMLLPWPNTAPGPWRPQERAPERRGALSTLAVVLP